MSMPAYSGQDLYGVIQAIVREELTRLHTTELGEVTEVFSHESDSDKNNYQVSVTLRDSGLLLPQVTVATQRIGAVAIPNVGDLVIIQFIGGDIHRPIITGRVYNDVDRPPIAKPNEWHFECQDSEASDTRRFSAVFPNGNSINIVDDSATITIGDAVLVMQNDGSIELTAAKDINLNAEGDLNLQATGDLSLQAGGNIKLKADMDLSAEAGMNGELKAAIAATVEGSAEAKLKGPMLSIAGMTSFSAS